MTEIASDMQSETFIASKAQIAHRAGVSYRTVDNLLVGFENIGVVGISRRVASANSGRIKAPNQYTLLAIGNGDASTISNGCASTIGNGLQQTSVADNKEKNLRTNLEDDDEEGARKGDPQRIAAPQEQSSSSSSDASPDQEQARIEELIAIAKSAAKKPTELIAKLQPHFPQVDVREQYRSYLAGCKKKGLKPTASTFVKHWLPRVEPELKPEPRRAPATPVTAAPPPLSPEEQAKQDAECKQAALKLRHFLKNDLRDVA